MFDFRDFYNIPVGMFAIAYMTSWALSWGGALNSVARAERERERARQS